MESARALVLPSRAEGLPVVIMEAQDWSLKRFNRTSAELLRLMSDVGYGALDLDGRPFAGDSTEGDYVNLLFVPTP